MVEQHEERYGQRPGEILVDGGFVKKEDIDEVSPPQGGTTVYAPVMKSKDPNRDAHEPREDDSPAVADWRRRMATEEAKEIYKQRTPQRNASTLRLATEDCSDFLFAGWVKFARSRCGMRWPIT